MNYNIDYEEMTKKTNIENNLLSAINSNLFNSLEDIKEIHSMSKYHSNNDIIQLDNLINIESLINNDSSQTDKLSKLIDKIVSHAKTSYNAFQYFYLNKKSFMGMNLTGLVDGKIETGLGFRNTIVKLYPKSNTTKTKYPQLYEYVNSQKELFACTYSIYGVKVNNMDDDIVSKHKITNILFVWDSDKKTYFVLGEK